MRAEQSLEHIGHRVYVSVCVCDGKLVKLNLFLVAPFNLVSLVRTHKHTLLTLKYNLNLSLSLSLSLSLVVCLFLKTLVI